MERKLTRAQNPGSIMSYYQWRRSKIHNEYDVKHPFDTPTQTIDDETVATYIINIRNANEKYYRDTGVNNIYKAHKARRMAANQVFTKYIIGDLYNQVISVVDDEQDMRIIKAVASKIVVSGKVYGDVIKPAIENILQERGLTEEYAKKLKDPRTGENYYSALCKAEVYKYIDLNEQEPEDQKAILAIKNNIKKWIKTLAGFDVTKYELK